MIELPNSEGALREWLKTFSEITDLVGSRVWFAVPEQDRPQLPGLVLYRVGGRPDSHGQDYPRMVIESWGVNKKQASDLAKIVAGTIVDSVNQKPVYVLDDGKTVEVISGEVDSGPRESGKTTWAKRYRLDVTFMLRYA